MTKIIPKVNFLRTVIAVPLRMVDYAENFVEMYSQERPNLFKYLE